MAPIVQVAAALLTHIRLLLGDLNCAGARSTNISYRLLGVKTKLYQKPGCHSTSSAKAALAVHKDITSAAQYALERWPGTRPRALECWPGSGHVGDRQMEPAHSFGSHSGAHVLYPQCNRLVVLNQSNDRSGTPGSHGVKVYIKVARPGAGRCGRLPLARAEADADATRVLAGCHGRNLQGMCMAGSRCRSVAAPSGRGPVPHARSHRVCCAPILPAPARRGARTLDPGVRCVIGRRSSPRRCPCGLRSRSRNGLLPAGGSTI